ncbi:MAG: hypothetical protein H3C64_13055, partial [Candidatus Kuenenia stuttgartiensis]|nr:hypothetical protein [Candidatus Kuenenia stuttgartiensis]
PVRKIKIDFREIENVRLLENRETIGLLRVFGVGGLFGYFGKYYNSKIGSVNLYTSQRKNRILISTLGGNKYIISPDNLDLLKYLKSNM